MFQRLRLATLGLLFASASILLAGDIAPTSTDTRWVGRDWKSPYQTMRTQLHVTARNDQGRLDSIWIRVNVNLLQEAPLHVGEVEEFRIRARTTKGERGSHRIDVELETMQWYHSYPAYRWKTVTVWGSGSSTVWFDLSHGGRIEGGAAPSVDQVSVGYDDLEGPWDLRFRDFGFEPNGSVPTEYGFSVHRFQLWGDDKLVAKGVFPWQDAEKQHVRVTRDGPYTGEAEEWFQDGKEYVVRLRVRRIGSEWYTDAFGDVFSGTFVWNGETRQLEPTSREVRARSPRDVRREESFSELHR